MAINQLDRNDAKASADFGARTTQRSKSAQSVQRVQPAIADVSARLPRDARGNDPYNTSGSFDRAKNWERVRKR